MILILLLLIIQTIRFLNLSNKHIPPNISNLLQLSEGFCLPISLNKKNAVYEFIKDIEGNMTLSNIIKSKVRCTMISQLNRFLDTRIITNTKR